MDTYPYEVAARLPAGAWEVVFHLLQVRSGNRCEAGTVACLGGRGGDLSGVPRDRVSIHHRLPRGRGGSADTRTNTLSRLMLLCGDGARGCHGWIESNRAAARDAGWLIPGTTDHTAIDSEAVRVHLRLRQWVTLFDDAPVYGDPGFTRTG